MKISSFKYVKIVVYAPAPYADLIREVLAKTGCGHIGNYNCCSFSSRGIGCFRPLKNSKPFIGKMGRVEKVAEERIETICLLAKLKKALKALKKAHPYEEPAIDIYPLLT